MAADGAGVTGTSDATVPFDPPHVCMECGERHPFDMPADLLADALAGRLVILAGAGVSTETRLLLGHTFADTCRNELGDSAGDLDFPNLMTAYEARFGRAQLLQRARGRFDYIRSFPRLQLAASRFHRELSTMPFLTEVLTTNWDTYFESFASATPIVIPDDYAFWNLPGRKVIKLHGSMNNLGTVVATAKDYDSCYRRLDRGTIGASLKHILATKRIVFIGYSFGDSDLTRLIKFVRKELGDVLPRSYVVSPHGYEGADFPPERVISTDGTHFLEVMKQSAVEAGAMRSDDVYEVVDDLMERVLRARRRSAVRFHPSKYPSAIYNWAYEDGMLHALGRIHVLRPSGYYSHPNAAHSTIHAYELAYRGAVKKRQYFDAAYIHGYLNGMLTPYIGRDAVTQAPVYFVWGAKRGNPTFKEFSADLRKAGQLHKGATAKAERMVAKMGGLVPVHGYTLDVEDLMVAGGYTGPVPSVTIGGLGD
jgi:hypothetical protein